MLLEVKRAAELSVSDFLNFALPTFKFYPSRGGTLTEDATNPEPPFGVVLVDEAEQPQASDVWMLHGHIVWVTHMDRSTVVEASGQARTIQETLKGYPSGADAFHQLLIHGIDIQSTNEFNDNERTARGDIIAFSLGVTQMQG